MPKMAKKSGILLPKTSQWSILGEKPEDFTPKIGARGRTWTGTMSPSRDFKSLASAYSTTRAHKNVKFWEVFVNFEPRCWKFTAYRLLSPLRLPIPPQRHKLKTKKTLHEWVQSFLEAPPGFEPGVEALQAHALPLGYSAVSVAQRHKKEKQHGRFGAGNEIRTRDIHLGKVTLYHWAIPAYAVRVVFFWWKL